MIHCCLGMKLFHPVDLFLLAYVIRVPTPTMACANGYIGTKCEMPCHCKGGNSKCENGLCIEGCHPDYIGLLCQYRAFPPSEDSKLTWLYDGNVDTCNDGTVPLHIKPAFQTSVTIMRLTFREHDMIHSTSFYLYNEEGKAMSCFKEQSQHVDFTNDRAFDVPCYTRKVVHSITIDGDGARELCELLISPGRNTASNQVEVGRQTDNGGEAQPTVDGESGKAPSCITVSQSRYDVQLFGESEVNMILVSNADESKAAEGLGEFSLWLTSNRQSGEYKIFESPDTGYSPVYFVVPKQQEINVTSLAFVSDKTTAPTLCGVEILGEVHRCCWDSAATGCLDFLSNAAVCSRSDLSSCPAGRKGELCNEECEEGFFGIKCKQKCNNHCQREWCSSYDGRCYRCEAGYTGETCNEMCAPHLYGLKCRATCSEYCKEDPQTGRRCHHVSGFCDNGCKFGRLGTMCQYEKCSEHCRGGSRMCDRRFGVCWLGCETGYSGIHCDIECPKGTHGELCEETCNSRCMDGECRSGDGACTKGCQPGYTSPHCEDTCGDSQFGDNCGQNCSAGCEGKICDHVMGNCSRCNPGAYGPTCSRLCEYGWYGSDCANICSLLCKNGACDPASGKCYSCVQGREGDFCEHKKRERFEGIPGEFNYIAAIAMSVGVFILLLMVSCCITVASEGTTRLITSRMGPGHMEIERKPQTTKGQLLSTKSTTTDRTQNKIEIANLENEANLASTEVDNADSELEAEDVYPLPDFSRPAGLRSVSERKSVPERRSVSSNQQRDSRASNSSAWTWISYWSYGSSGSDTDSEEIN